MSDGFNVWKFLNESEWERERKVENYGKHAKIMCFSRSTSFPMYFKYSSSAILWSLFHMRNMICYRMWESTMIHIKKHVEKMFYSLKVGILFSWIDSRNNEEGATNEKTHRFILLMQRNIIIIQHSVPCLNIFRVIFVLLDDEYCSFLCAPLSITLSWWAVFFSWNCTNFTLSDFKWDFCIYFFFIMKVINLFRKL